MKIAAVIESDISTGGGFNQGLNAILQMARLCKGHFDFVALTSSAVTAQHLAQLGVTAKTFKPRMLDAILSWFATSRLGRRLQDRARLVGPFERTLLDLDVDLVYFVSATTYRPLSLQRLNYITTVWDLCHRDFPEFLEIRQSNAFLSLEHIYQHTLAQATFVVCDSAELADNASRRYGLDRARLQPMPFAPAPFLDEIHAETMDSVLGRYSLEPGYLFYPAQFWPHKNHVRILEALALLKAQGRAPHVVFCGGEVGSVGSAAVVRRKVEELHLASQVHLLGFVPPGAMRALYEGCAAVVMPTYFGPTNIPPLEAWSMGRPLIYSAHLRDQAGDAAAFADADSAEELANAMQQVLNPDVAADLVEKGAKRLKQIDAERLKAEQEILARLHQFAARRDTWQ